MIHFSQSNADAHEHGCMHAERTEQNSGGYVDVFCGCHRYAEPRILQNPTDIAWPAGWTEAQAAEWRRKNDLAPPSRPGSGA